MRLRFLIGSGILSLLLAAPATPQQTPQYQQTLTEIIKKDPTSPNGLGTSILGVAFEGSCSESFTVMNNNPSIFTVSPSSGTNVGFNISLSFSGVTMGFGTAVIDITSFGPGPGCAFTAPYYVLVDVYSGIPTTPLSYGQTTEAYGINEPISTATGELFGHDEKADLMLGGPTALQFRRYYSAYLSANNVSSALGTNWMHNFDYSVSVSGTTATVTLFRGKTVTFDVSGAAPVLSSNEKLPYQLQNGAGGTLEFLDPASNLIYTFSSTGSLSSIADRNGNTITVTQGANGPAQVSDGLGRTLTFTYTNGHLTAVQDQSGRSVGFQYSGGALSAFTDANGHKATFAYTSSNSVNALITAETRPAGNMPFTQTYDSLARVSSQADSFSNTLSLSYTGANQGATVSETAGVSFTQGYDTNYNLTSQSDPSGAVSTFTYDSNNRPISSTDRLGNKTTATWDPASGLMASYADELGNTTSYTYTASTFGPFTFHDLTGIQFADGATISLARDANGNVTAATDQAGNVWQATYNSNGWPTTLTNASGGAYSITYNNDGTRAGVQTPSSDTTTFGYDAVSRLNLITNPDSTTESLAYDAVSNLLKVTDERSNSDSATFDANNNPKTVTDALAATSTLAFDTDDRHTSTTDPLGNAITAAWDTQSRLHSLTNAAGNQVVWTYDNLNRITGIADASGNGFTFGLDQENRPLSITDALSRTVTYTRNAHGSITALSTPKMETYTFSHDMRNRVSTRTDPLGRTTQYMRDARGLLSSVVLPGAIAAEFSRNALGLITGITDPVDNVWSRSFDNMGRLTSKTDPLNRKSSFAYDSRQRLATVTLPMGTAQYAYDAASNLTSLVYSDGTSLSYTWDADNRLSTASGLSLSYDADGRISKSNGLVMTRDAAGRLLSVTYASGKTVTYTYNQRGLLTQVADWVGGTTTFTYDDAEELTSVAYANGITENYTWDKDSHALTLTVAKGSSTLSSISLTRDALGRVTKAVRSSANIPAEATGTLALSYDAASQVMGETWDGLGRLTSDAQRNYTWDLASRLTSYTGSNGSASFTYDAMGQRLSRTSSGATQNYVWNYAFPLPVLSTVQSGGSDQTYYVWLPNGALLNSISAANNARRFYHFDESGSTVLLTDSTGAVTDTYAISIYGDTATQTGSTANPFTFQGQYGVMSEGSTSLYYMRARYYDSGPARFLSRDPLLSFSPRAVNPYQFAYANPVEHADASGKLTQEEGNQFAEAFWLIPTLGFVNTNEGTKIVGQVTGDRSVYAPVGGYTGSLALNYPPNSSGGHNSLTDPDSVLNFVTTPSDDNAVFVPTEYAPDLTTPDETAPLDEVGVENETEADRQKRLNAAAEWERQKARQAEERDRLKGRQALEALDEMRRANFIPFVPQLTPADEVTGAGLRCLTSNCSVSLGTPGSGEPVRTLPIFRPLKPMPCDYDDNEFFAMFLSFFGPR